MLTLLVPFRYDVKSNQKKKLTCKISFPAELDLTRFASPSSQRQCFRLRAMLLHRGASANCGHYFTHLNDEEVGKKARMPRKTPELADLFS